MSGYNVEQLKQFLDSDAVPETCYDYIQLHGFLTALSISPVAVDQNIWLPEIFDGEPDFMDDTEKQNVLSAIDAMSAAIARTLYSGEVLGLPCALHLGSKPDLSPLRGWALGFMEAVGLNEDQWFSDQEEEVGELLLPVVLAAGLFDDPELAKLAKDTKQMKVLLDRIPENLSELYLLFRDSPDQE